MLFIRPVCQRQRWHPHTFSIFVQKRRGENKEGGSESETEEKEKG